MHAISEHNKDVILAQLDAAEDMLREIMDKIIERPNRLGQLKRLVNFAIEGVVEAKQDDRLNHGVVSRPIEHALSQAEYAVQKAMDYEVIDC
jgi:hypothetical protein